jgi:hypothetical protein
VVENQKGPRPRRLTFRRTTRDRRAALRPVIRQIQTISGSRASVVSCRLPTDSRHGTPNSEGKANLFLFIPALSKARTKSGSCALDSPDRPPVTPIFRAKTSSSPCGPLPPAASFRTSRGTAPAASSEYPCKNRGSLEQPIENRHKRHHEERQPGYRR